MFNHPNIAQKAGFINRYNWVVYDDVGVRQIFYDLICTVKRIPCMRAVFIVRLNFYKHTFIEFVDIKRFR